MYDATDEYTTPKPYVVAEELSTSRMEGSAPPPEAAAAL
jgi:hypothetical protein